MARSCRFFVGAETREVLKLETAYGRGLGLGVGLDRSHQPLSCGSGARSDRECGSAKIWYSPACRQRLGVLQARESQLTNWKSVGIPTEAPNRSGCRADNITP